MQDVTKAIFAIQQNFDRIVYLSSGEAPDIEMLLKKATQVSIYLPAGNELDRCAELLEDKGLGNVVQLYGAYLCSGQNDGNFYQSNIAKYSSASQPQAIKKLIPGLTFNKINDSKNISMTQLLEREALSNDESALLVLDINGTETSLTNELTTLAKVFESLVIKTSPQNLYGNANTPMNSLSERFIEMKLVPVVFPESSPPFVNLVVSNVKQHLIDEMTKSNQKKQKRLNKLLKKVQQLQENLELASESKQALEAQKAELSQTIEQLRNDTSTQKAQIEAQIEAQQSAEMLSQKLKVAETLLADKENQLEAKASVIAELTEKAETHADALKSEQERSLQLESQINDLRSNIETLTDEKQAYEASSENLKAKYEKLEQDKQWIEEELRKAKSRVEEQSQSVKIANKLNLKLQIDLDDLRKKYTEKEQNERELSQLIDELYVKLKQASEFYYELEKKYPELTDEQRD